ncbi:MAG: DNA repair protein RecO [Cyanobacteria bacterium SIG26]|nr:DNA repair protein RecO [Cyanobacteria bacterium SIG26]
MQNSFVTDAINLKSYNLSEADKIMVMYSKEKGLIRGVAKGVKKPKSKLGARMDLLVANTLMLHKGKNLDTICQAEVVNTFYKTRQDIDKICYSTYVTEVVHNFGIEEDPCSSIIYDLLYQTLDAIAKSQTKIEIMIAVIKFQLKMMIESGFSIELDKCLCCHHDLKEETMYFVPNMGGIICQNCANNISYGKKQIPHKLRDFFKQMAINSFDEKGEYETKANEKVCTVTFEALKEYIALKSPKKFKSTNILQEV